MKKILNTIFLATFLFAAACSDGYDDTRIKKDLDDVVRFSMNWNRPWTDSVRRWTRSRS